MIVANEGSRSPVPGILDVRAVLLTLSWTVIMGGAVAAHAQTVSPPLAQRTASCRQNVDSLANRIRLDYAGFHLEVVGAKAERYGDTLTALQRVASSTEGESCVPVLRALIDWFDDPHLFLYQADVADTTDAGRRRAAVIHRDMDERSARHYFATSGKTLDPIEGIWYDNGLRVAIVAAQNQEVGVFNAVVVNSDTVAWHVGEVRAQFRRDRTGAYDATVWSKSRVPKTLRGVIYRRTLLRLSPGIWGKEFPVASADSGYLNPVDPHRATLRTRGRTVVVTIPSHDPGNRYTLDTLLALNDSVLRRADVLIVDVRGNEGGSAWVTNGLRPFIASSPPRASHYPDEKPLVLSSPDQIRYVTQTFVGPKGLDASPSTQRLLARMRADSGKLVPLGDSLDAPEPPAPTPIIGPRKVAVLVDRGTVSAGEVLVLQALASTRAVVVGEPTAGALDYQSVSIVWFSSAERRWGLGYPTVTRSASLPRNGMRGIGIEPDVKVRWESIADPISYVEQLLTKRQ